MLTCVGWKVTLCDPIWQVTLRSCEMVYHEQLYQTLPLPLPLSKSRCSQCQMIMFGKDIVKSHLFSWRAANGVSTIHTGKMLHTPGLWAMGKDNAIIFGHMASHSNKTIILRHGIIYAQFGRITYVLLSRSRLVYIATIIHTADICRSLSYIHALH